MKAMELGIGIGTGFLVYLFFLGWAQSLLPILLLIGVLIYFSHSVGLKNPNNKKFKPLTEKTSGNISFKDIGGQEVAKREVIEALDFAEKRGLIESLGIRPLRGILLVGPPGTGKTLLAKGAANYTGSAFLSTSGSEFIEMYAGVGASRVRDLFKRAREAAKEAGKNSAIIFIDELEVLGGKRGRHTSHLEYDQTLNQLLVEMDGLGTDDQIQILLIGATNRADLLDDALLRPGRFDRHVQVDLPDKEGRLEILKLHARNKPLTDDVDLEVIAKETFGFSGAHLENVTNEAAILAMREQKTQIEQKHLVEAIDKVMLGEKAQHKVSTDEKRRVAIHEAGHALMNEYVRPDSVGSVTISPRGKALGFVRQTPAEETLLHTTDYLKGQINILLAGAIAEELIYGNRSTGARNDFEKSLELAQLIVYSGLSTLGIVSESSLPKEKLHNTVSEILRQCEESTRSVLNSSILTLNNLADILTDREKLSGDELRAILAEGAFPVTNEKTS